MLMYSAVVVMLYGSYGVQKSKWVTIMIDYCCAEGTVLLIAEAKGQWCNHQLEGLGNNVSTLDGVRSKPLHFLHYECCQWDLHGTNLN